MTNIEVLESLIINLQNRVSKLERKRVADHKNFSRKLRGDSSSRDVDFQVKLLRLLAVRGPMYGAKISGAVRRDKSYTHKGLVVLFDLKLLDRVQLGSKLFYSISERGKQVLSMLDNSVQPKEWCDRDIPEPELKKMARDVELEAH